MSEIRATILDPVTLVSSGWTPISFPECGSVLLQCRSDIDVYIANELNPGNAFFTLKAGQGLIMDVKVKDMTLYGKASAGTVFLEAVCLSV